MSCRDEGLFFWRIAVDIGDWTSLQMGEMLGFVEPNFVWSSLTTWPDPNNVAWFLMGDLLRRFLVLSCLMREKKHCSRTLYSSLIIVKFLQLCGYRQIAEPYKYCLVHVIVFLWRVFSLFFCFSQVGNSG